MIYLKNGLERVRQFLSPLKKELLSANDYLNRFGRFSREEQKFWIERQQEIIKEHLVKPGVVFDHDFATTAAFYSGELAVRDIEPTITDPTFYVELVCDHECTETNLLRRIRNTMNTYSFLPTLTARDVLVLNTLNYRYMFLMHNHIPD